MMAYLVIQKDRKGGDWQVATSAFVSTEHGAAARQKAIERSGLMQTARIFVELPA